MATKDSVQVNPTSPEALVAKTPHKKVMTGVVISTKNTKTIVVKVEKSLPHFFYNKNIIKHRKYHVHDETSQAKEGNTVKFISCRPISAMKK